MNNTYLLKNILYAVLLFTFNSMYAQDRIVTVNNDTLDCRIVSISDTYLNYEQLDGGHTIGKFIPVSEVRIYYKGESRPEKVKISYSGSKRLQLGATFGGAYRLVSTASAQTDMINTGISSSAVKDYLKNLKHGISIGAGAHYFCSFWKSGSGGVGAKYKFAYFNSNLSSMIPDQYSPSYYFYSVNERQYINYFGLSIITQQRLDSRGKFKLQSDISAGFTHLRDELRFDERSVSNGYNMFVTGMAFGQNIEASFLWQPVSYFSASANAGVFFASFWRLNVTNREGTYKTGKLDRDDRINVSQLNYSLGIQFHF